MTFGLFVYLLFRIIDWAIQPVINIRVGYVCGESLAFKPVSASRECGEIFGAASYAASTWRPEWCYSYSVKIRGFNECIHYPRSLTMPDRITGIKGWAVIQRKLGASYFRTGRRISHFQRRSALAVAIIKIFRCKRLWRNYRIKLSACNIRYTFSDTSCVSRGRKLGEY